MKLHTLNRLLAFQLALVIFLTFAGCKKSGVSSVDGTSVAADTSAADNFSSAEESVAASDAADGNTDSDPLAKYITENGKIDTSELTPYKASEVATVNGRNIFKHNGKPYLYNAMHFRYDDLNTAYGPDTAKEILDQGMQKIKESGIDTVILYIYWRDMYDGKNYNFDNLKMQYDTAIRHDLKIQINWFGYNNCGYGGFMKWQTDRAKYPALKINNPKITKEIPDLSKQIFIDEETEAIRQLCAFINIYDKDRRTVAVQLENEPDNGEGGMGDWLSQFSNMVNLLNKLGEAVHGSVYSMITKVNLTMTGWDEIQEGFDYPTRINKVIEQPHLDLVGPDVYDVSTVHNISFYEKGTNIPVHLEIGPSPWSVIGQSVYHLASGYGMGYYGLAESARTVDSGLYRFDDMRWIERDGTKILAASNYKGQLECNTREFIAMSHSVDALRELLASVPVSDMVGFNVNMKNVVSDLRKLDGKRFTYDYNNPAAKYGACGLVLKGPDGAYYCFSTQTADFTFPSAPASVTYGYYKDGVWNEAGTASANGARVTLEAGRAYRAVL